MDLSSYAAALHNGFATNQLALVLVLHDVFFSELLRMLDHGSAFKVLHVPHEHSNRRLAFIRTQEQRLCGLESCVELLLQDRWWSSPG